MDRRLIITALGILCICLFLSVRKRTTAGKEMESVATEKAGIRSDGESSEVVASMRKRRIERRPAAPKATHFPDQLPQFMLPDLQIEGLPLEQALEKLKSLYDEVCRQTNELPVALQFKLPPQSGNLLYLQLPPGNVDASIRLLAAVSGLKVSRKGAEYGFAIPEETGELIERNMESRLGLKDTLEALAGREEGAAQLAVTELIKLLAFELDDSTHISATPSGFLALSTRSAADEATVAGLLAGVSASIQHKLEAQQVVIPAGSNITLPEDRQLTDAQTQSFLNELAQQKEIELTHLPSIIARSGQSGTIDMTRELIAPVDGSHSGFPVYQVGKILKIESNALGFGHRMDWSYEDSTAEIDPRTASVGIDMHANMGGSGFNDDRQTQVTVEERPDGSRVVLLLTPTLIDASGRPLSDE